jgi:serine protease
MASKSIRLLVLAVGVGVLMTAFGGSNGSGIPKDGRAASHATRSAPITQLIIKYRNGAAAGATTASVRAHVATLGKLSGLSLHYKRPMSGGAHVLTLSRSMGMAEARDLAKAIATDPAVLYAEPDAVRYVTLVPNDRGYAIGFGVSNSAHQNGHQGQWHLMGPSQTYSYTPYGGVSTTMSPAGGANLGAAWDASQGLGVVVGVVDTGVVDHVDLSANLVGGSAALSGYDFVSSDSNPTGKPLNWAANDGGGRDSDPSDPGDWITASEANTDCTQGDSSWHGTHVSGTIAAVTNNSIGVAGVAPLAKVLTGRALGKCGGFTSDISDAIRWVAGVAVDSNGANWSSLGIPANATPAKVVNLSLGGNVTATNWDPCTITEQNAINAVRAAGAVVVAAAGNDGQPHISSPGNCPGVIAVTGHTIEGDNADYSNIGPGHRIELNAPHAEVTGNSTTISAPGGGCGAVITSTTNPACADQFVWSTINSSLTSPTASPGGDTYGGYTGTSMATPHVAGVAALVMALKPSATPDYVRLLLQGSSRAFPSGTYCATKAAAGMCGSGMLDASAAVANVQAGKPAAFAGLAQTVAPGATVSLHGEAANAPGTSGALSYQWTVTSGTATLAGATTLSPTFTAPATGPVKLQLTVTSGGLSSSSTTTVYLNSAPVINTPAVPAVSSGAALAFDVTATDADGDPVTFTLVSGPSGASIAPAGHFSWPATGAAGNYTAVVQASDGLATSTLNVTIRVTGGANTAPVINQPISAPSVTAGSTATFTATATDAQGDPITFSMVSGPQGSSLSSGGAFSWLNAGPTGTYPVVIRAYDGALYSTNVTVNVVVTSASTAPPAASSSSGGGGAFDCASLLMFLLAGAGLFSNRSARAQGYD